MINSSTMRASSREHSSIRKATQSLRPKSRTSLRVISSKQRMLEREINSWLSSLGLERLSNLQTVRKNKKKNITVITFFITIIFAYQPQHILDNPVNNSPPDVDYTLEYVYGYRSEDSRQNVYFNSAGQAVYMTAALGVILDHKSNTQKFFGGGKVGQVAKNVSDDSQSHTDDITSLKISVDRNLAVSGQVGSAPAAFLWDTITGEKK